MISRRIHDFFNQETRTATTILRGTTFVTELLAIAVALKYLIFGM